MAENEGSEVAVAANNADNGIVAASENAANGTDGQVIKDLYFAAFLEHQNMCFARNRSLKCDAN